MNSENQAHKVVEAVPSYEEPRLTPLGNLRDLVAASGGSACDVAQPTPGGGHIAGDCA
jgi:hypothetical protein